MAGSAVLGFGSARWAPLLRPPPLPRLAAGDFFWPFIGVVALSALETYWLVGSAVKHWFKVVPFWFRVIVWFSGSALKK